MFSSPQSQNHPKNSRVSSTRPDPCTRSVNTLYLPLGVSKFNFHRVAPSMTIGGTVGRASFRRLESEKRPRLPACLQSRQWVARKLPCPLEVVCTCCALACGSARGTPTSCSGSSSDSSCPSRDACLSSHDDFQFQAPVHAQ